MNSKTANMVLAAICLSAFFVFAACTPERDPSTLFAPDAVGVLVVNSILIVGEPLPLVRLTRTQLPEAPFDNSSGVTSATISITFNGQTVSYRPLNQSGQYFPTGATIPLVLPETKYDLVAVVDGARLASSTTTPKIFDINEWSLASSNGQSQLRTLQSFDEEGDQVYFHPDNQLTYGEGLLDAKYLGSDATDHGAFGFQLALFSLDWDSDLVVDPPFVADEDLEDLPRLGSSPMMAGNHGFLRLPWFAIYYGGRHLYKVHAVDLNWFDFVRSVPLGGGSFGPGSNIGEGVDRPIFHVSGGIGLFGSASVDSTGFFIRPALKTD